MCSGLKVIFTDNNTKETIEWCYEQGLEAYLLQSLENASFYQSAILGSSQGDEGDC